MISSGTSEVMAAGGSGVGLRLLPGHLVNILAYPECRERYRV